MRRTVQVCAAAALVLTLASSTVATAAEPDQADSPALLDFGACLTAGGLGQIVVLLDESGSLRETDPDGDRVTAAQFLLRQFAEVADAGSELSVTLAGFSVDYTTVVGWTPLNGSTVGGLEAQLDQFKALNRGIDTDYWTALDGARRVLAEQQRAVGDAQTCQAVVWLSDGAFDVDPRSGDYQEKPYAPGVSLDDTAGAEEATRRGIEAMCVDGGITDQVHSAGITTFGVGLDRTDSVDFTTFSAVATGDGCGKLGTEDSGDFFAASSLEDLLRAFNRIRAAGRLLEQSTPTCVADPAEDCAHQFVLDQSVGQVQLLATVTGEGPAGATNEPFPDVDVFLRPPGSDDLLLVSGESQATDLALGELTVSVRPETSRAVSLVLNRPAAGPWTGLWNLYFVATSDAGRQATGQSQVEISGDLLPAWPAADSTELAAGSVVSDIEFGLARRGTGEAVPPREILGTAAFSATFIGPDGTEIPLVDAVDAAAQLPTAELDLSDVPTGSATMRLELQVTTRGLDGPPPIAGTPLAAEAVDIPIEVIAPPEYPVVGDVNFGSDTEELVLSGQVPVTGSGCAWLEGVEELTTPEGAGGYTVSADAATTEETCVTAGDGAAIDVTLALDAAGTGLASGSLMIATVPAGGGDVLVQPADFTADVIRPLDRQTFWLTFVVALLLGLGLPLLAAQLARWWAAQIPSTPLIAHVLPVTVGSDVTLPDGRPFAIVGRGTQLTIRRRTRELKIPESDVVLRVRTGWGLRSAGHVVVDAGEGRHTVAPPAVHVESGVARAQLPIVVHNLWTAVVTPGQPEALVIALPDLYANGDPAELRRIETSVRDALPRLSSQLAATLGATPMPAMSGPAPQSLWGEAAGPEAVPPSDAGDAGFWGDQGGTR